jgi:hypothetical protein
MSCCCCVSRRAPRSPQRLLVCSAPSAGEMPFARRLWRPDLSNGALLAVGSEQVV